MKKCAILIPIYRDLTDIEIFFVVNNISKNINYPVIFIGPDWAINFVKKFLLTYKNTFFISFEEVYFKSTRTYNQLMLSENFYKRFTDYEYILIAQTDAFIFKNDLSYWYNQSYDYIGAPWFRYNKLNKGKLFWWFYKNTYQKYLTWFRKSGWLYNKVGNGGLSLRKINSFLESLKKVPHHILEKYKNSTNDNYNEDVFWSIEIAKYNKNFKIPPFEIALQFSVEQDPENAVKKYLRNELPYGCHDPIRQNKAFWSNYIHYIKS